MVPLLLSIHFLGSLLPPCRRSLCGDGFCIFSQGLQGQCSDFAAATPQLRPEVSLGLCCSAILRWHFASCALPGLPEACMWLPCLWRPTRSQCVNAAWLLGREVRLRFVLYIWLRWLYCLLSCPIGLICALRSLLYRLFALFTPRTGCLGPPGT